MGDHLSLRVAQRWEPRGTMLHIIVACSGRLTLSASSFPRREAFSDNLHGVFIGPVVLLFYEIRSLPL